MKILTHLKKHGYILYLSLFLLALLPRIFLFHTEYWRTPDAIEYINVAQNLISGNGLTQSIKWHFFDSQPVITSAFYGKPFFVSIVFAMLLNIINNNYFLQFFLLLIGALNVILFFILLKKFFTPKYSFIFSLFAAFNPNLLITNRLVLSEPIFTTFVLLFFILLFSKKTNFKFILLGTLSALAFETRTEGILLLITLPFIKEKSIKNISLFFVSFLIVVSPFTIISFFTIHKLFYSYNPFHFKVFNFSDAMWNGYKKIFPSPINFIKDNFLWIISAVFHLFIYNIESILSFASIGILGIFFLFFKKIKSVYFPLMLFSAAFILLFSLFWSAFSEPERHFAPIYFLLLIPIYSFVHTKLKKILFIFLAIMFVLYLGLDIHRIYWARVSESTLDNNGLENKTQIYDWIKNNTRVNDIIADDNPWMVYLNTKRPSIIFSPDFEKVNLLNKYISQYSVSYIISNARLNKSSVFSSNGITIYCGKKCSIK